VDQKTNNFFPLLGVLCVYIIKKYNMEYHSTLLNLDIYRIADTMSDLAWKIYNDLPKTHRFHIGDQLLRCTDSVGANIAEGNGRFHYKDKLNYLFNSRGSLVEVFHWISLLNKRELIDRETYAEFYALHTEENKKINAFINYYKRKYKVVYK